ncbi:MAG TPA: MBL fold metallo-hydrolase [Pyrinomonadaceae bacterium]|nr:MBL fold metallo-hydrolase [Pyrinomonadaceae bacterium]
MAPAPDRALYIRIGLVLLFILMNATVLFADSVNTSERTVTKVAEGVYVIRHKDAPDGFPQGNTTVIIGEREVFVVDSCYLPSAARDDIAQVRQWTNKPVRYLLNTHWHYDHTMGNGTYAEAFPQLAIIAQIETRKQMEGYNPGWFAKYPTRAERFKRLLDTGKDAEGRPLTEIQKRDYASALAGVEPVGAEFKSVVDRLPNLMFSDELDIDIGNREVQVKHLGRGNTAGDAVVYLPKEKILIAGDLLDHPVPYLGGGYPSELVRTLRSMGQLDAQTIIPGHGDVLRGDYAKTYLNQVIEFLSVVVAQVSLEVYKIGNGSRNFEAVREAVQKEIDFNAWRQKFAGDDKDNREFFDGFSLPGLLTAAFAEVWGR